VAITIMILSYLKSSFKIQKRDFLTLFAPLHTFSQALLTVPDRVKLSFVIFDIRAL